MSEPSELIDGNMDAILMQLHDISMTADPSRACQARLAKCIAPGLEGWISDEASRMGSVRSMDGIRDVSQVLLAAYCGGMTIIMSTVYNLLPTPEARQDVLKKMRPILLDMYDKRIEMIGQPQDSTK